MSVDEKALAGRFFTNQSFSRLDPKNHYVLPRTVRLDLVELEKTHGNTFMMNVYWEVARWIAVVEWREKNPVGQWRTKFRYHIKRERKYAEKKIKVS